MKGRLTWAIAAALLAGVAVGCVMNALVADPDQRTSIAHTLSIVTDIFLRLIKMIIAPLVFSTLVLGVARMDGAGALGRVGARTLGWFLIASATSLLLGLALASLLQPGAGLDLGAAASGSPLPTAQPLDLHAFLVKIFPTSVIDAMAQNDILQIVVFSLFVGFAISALGERAASVLHVVERIAEIMLKVTGYVMLVAPLAVFAALASTITTQGAAILLTYLKLIGGFYLGLAILAGLLLGSARLIVGRRGAALLPAVREPLAIAFATASSEAAYPKLLESLERYGVANRIASFVLPLGYSFNQDGAMMFCTFAVLFIAQAYGVQLSLGEMVTLFGILMISTKGLAGVPRASIVVIAAALPTFKLPEAGLLLILAVDHVLDMGRTGVNVIGNAVAATLVARWEGELQWPSTADPSFVESAS